MKLWEGFAAVGSLEAPAMKGRVDWFDFAKRLELQETTEHRLLSEATSAAA